MRLLERRQELETKARELELRETLLKAAEKKLEAKLSALKAKEAAPDGRKDEAEAKQLELLAAEKIDLVVMARYMQILSAEFVAHFPSRIINIHHSSMVNLLQA